MPNRRQLALLRVAVSRLGLDDEAYRGLLAQVGARSSLQLTNAQFDTIMQALRRAGFQDDTPRRAPLGERPGMATDAQIATIRARWEEFSERDDDEAALRKWLRRFGVSDLRFLDAGAAQKVITALRSMLARRSEATAPAPAPRTRHGSGDPAVAAFVDEALRAALTPRGDHPHGTVTHVRAMCLERFGAAKAPPASALYHRAQAIRQEAASQRRGGPQTGEDTTSDFQSF